MYTIQQLFDLNHTIAKEYLERFTYPFQALFNLNAYISSLEEMLKKEGYISISTHTWVHQTAKISQNATLEEYCVIGKNTQVRSGAYLRGNVIVGDDCVVGNSTELKNCILFDGVQVPHYNYVGDSILGYKAHLGAGAILSNVRLDKKNIVYKDGEKDINTQRKKVGAMLGDGVEVGCNCVLNPGTIVGKYAKIYPLTKVKGMIEEGSIYRGE